MTDYFEKRHSLSRDTLASAVGDETVILHMKSGSYFGLNAVGTRIWTLLNEGFSPAAIRAQLAEEFDVAPDVLETDLRDLLAELVAHDIIAEPGRAGD